MADPPPAVAFMARVRRAIADKGMMGRAGAGSDRGKRVWGAIPIADYMALANRQYYNRRDPFGHRGDFITAPEISQMFGEMIGLWIADMWHRADKAQFYYVELGAGRGTLARDALAAFVRCNGDGGGAARRGGANAGDAGRWLPTVHYVENSPLLRAMQSACGQTIAGAAGAVSITHHSDSATLPDDKPLLIIANEFFDALPIEQYIATAQGWRERMVTCPDEHGDGSAGTRGGEGSETRTRAGAIARNAVLVPIVGEKACDDYVPYALRSAPLGAVYERSPSGCAIVAALATRLVRQGGAMAIFDYGYAGPALGDTLQAVANHAPVDVFAAAGEHDISAHVDFTALAHAATRGAGAVPKGAGSEIGRVMQGVPGRGVRGMQGGGNIQISSLVAQGQWLHRLGIGARLEQLCVANPSRRAELQTQYHRLTSPQAMGELFKVMSLYSHGWPTPLGF